MQINQRTSDWEALRQKNIGSSDIAVILGVSPFPKTLHDLWEEKKGIRPLDPPNSYMIRGTELEPEAREAYVSRTQNFVNPKVILHEKKPYIASLDGITMEGDIIVEIKCPVSIKSLESAKNEKIKPHYYAQIQWQLMLSGAKMAHLWIYHPECDAVLKEVLPDIPFQKQLTEVADKFWDLVVNDIEPTKVETEVKHFDSIEFIMAAELFKEAKAKVKLAEEEEKVAKDQLLSCTDGGNFEGCGIKGIWMDGRITVNWKAVCEKFGIKDEDLVEFSKQSSGFYQIKVQ